MGLGPFLQEHGHPFVGVRFYAHEGAVLLSDVRFTGQRAAYAGCVVPRLELDNVLLQHAVAAGARFFPAVREVTKSPDSQGGVMLAANQHGHAFTIRAELILIATGANRALLAAWGLIAGSAPSGLARRLYLEGVPDLVDMLEIHIDQDVFPGYAWLFPTGAATANLGAGIELDGRPTAEAGRLLRRAMQRMLQSPRLAGARIIEEVQGYPLYTDFPNSVLSGPRLLVTGEAAGLVDPITGEGIALALESGRMAAQVAHAALEAGDCSGAFLRQYDEQLVAHFGRYFTDARELVLRVSDSRVRDTLIARADHDVRVHDALAAAVLDAQPQRAIAILQAVTEDSEQTDPLVGPNYMLATYRPLLDQCRECMLAEVAKDTPSPLLLELLRRGKMLRALLVMLGCQAAGGEPQQVLMAAAGIELVHAASLIHDDLMDRAAMRRGRPAVHMQLGADRAIVCGDYLIAKSFRLLAASSSTCAPANVVRAFMIGADSGIRTCAGQFHDLQAWTAATLAESTYQQVVIEKTAAAIQGALLAGAALAGADDELLAALAEFGGAIGKAFQIKDDIQDAADLLARKADVDRRVTLPLIYAFWATDEAGKTLLLDFLDNGPLDPADVARLLMQTHAIEKADHLAESIVAQALASAGRFPQQQGIFRAVAKYMVARSS
jgi:geranylgeranyl diphosphate synthase type I